MVTVTVQITMEPANEHVLLKPSVKATLIEGLAAWADEQAWLEFNDAVKITITEVGGASTEGSGIFDDDAASAVPSSEGGGHGGAFVGE
jgi:hypothetical protein